jgi:rRNA maturation endonuclease Nob1
MPRRSETLHVIGWNDNMALANGLRIGFGALVLGVLVVVVLILFSSFRGTSKRCSRCKEVNRPPAIFCAQCGTRLSQR